MKKLKANKMTKLILLLVIILSVCVGFFTFNKGNKKVADKIQIKNTAPKDNKDIVEASGVVKASNATSIAITFSGEIIKVNVKEGQKVKKGDSLLSVNFGELNTQISNKASELDAAEFELKNAKRDREALNREDTPVQPGTPAVNKEDLKYKADNNINMLNDKIAIIQNELKSLKEKLNKAYIKDKDIICDLDNAVVTELAYKNGEVINPAQKLLSLLDLNSLFIEAKINEEFIRDVQIGKDVIIKPIADTSKKYTGKVISMPSSAITANGETYLLVQISIDNKDGFLLPNYNVDLEINRK
jgi:multidrug resistance efflux pump